MYLIQFIRGSSKRCIAVYRNKSRRGYECMIGMIQPIIGRLPNAGTWRNKILVFGEEEADMKTDGRKEETAITIADRQNDGRHRLLCPILLTVIKSTNQQPRCWKYAASHSAGKYISLATAISWWVTCPRSPKNLAFFLPLFSVSPSFFIQCENFPFVLSFLFVSRSTRDMGLFPFARTAG